jgi:hypothetical protein
MEVDINCGTEAELNVGSPEEANEEQGSQNNSGNIILN